MAKKSLFDRFRERTKKKIQPTPVEENLKPRGTRYLSGFKDAPVEIEDEQPINKPIKPLKMFSKPEENIVPFKEKGGDRELRIDMSKDVGPKSIAVFRSRMKALRDKRQRKYETDIRDRADRQSDIKKKLGIPSMTRQERYDQQFGGRPFGEGTVLSRYSSKSGMQSRIQDRIEKNIARRAKEAEDEQRNRRRNK